MKILVLGANGFIGGEVARDLASRGHAVTGLARRLPAASGAIAWIEADMARLGKPEDWLALLGGFEAVVNCAGALQSGARDDVTALQRDSILALIAACERIGLSGPFVNISAPLEGSGAATPFLATKREADERLARSGLRHVVLRPALVVGRNAHGGSALIRALAAFPLVTPLVFAQSRICVAALDEVCAAVARAISGEIASGDDCLIASRDPMTLAEIVARHRAWLGLPPAPTLALPAPVARLAGAAADFLGLLGWRSPMRSTAMSVSMGGIAGAEPGGNDIASPGLDSILAAAPAGVQDLWFARLYLLKPVVFGLLALFWFVSGAVALARFGQTSGLAVAHGLAAPLAGVVTAATALADIAIGAGIAVRRTSRAALLASLAFCAFYLAGASVLSPALWLDPLGPLVKIFPAALLSVVALAIFEERT